MANIADIIVFDGAAVPVSHTLRAVSVTREKGKVVALWRESLPGVPVYAQIRCQMSLERTNNGMYKTECRTVVPVMESVTGQNVAGYTAAPKVAYENQTVITGWFHERSDIAGRRLCRQTGINIGGNIATTVTPVATGPLPELFDQLLAPT